MIICIKTKAFKNINSNVAALVCEEEEYALNLDVKKSDNDQIPSKISISFQKGCRTVLKMGSRILSFTLIFWSLVIALRYNL
jgi:hypothetical protein